MSKYLIPENLQSYPKPSNNWPLMKIDNFLNQTNKKEHQFPWENSIEYYPPPVKTKVFFQKGGQFPQSLTWFLLATGGKCFSKNWGEHRIRWHSNEKSPPLPQSTRIICFLNLTSHSETLLFFFLKVLFLKKDANKISQTAASLFFRIYDHNSQDRGTTIIRRHKQQSTATNLN